MIQADNLERSDQEETKRDIHRYTHKITQLYI